MRRDVARDAIVEPGTHRADFLGRFAAGRAEVAACDLAKVPLGDAVLDVAIFSLSLMGSNFTSYIREAHRCLRLDGRLHIWEPTAYFEDVAAFTSKLSKLGFDVMAPETEGAFTRIAALRNARRPDPDLVLPFRGHAPPPAPGRATR